MAAPDGPDLTSVKFQFKNIGPIKDAELQLGDLTIIAGRNNTGKTYLVYTLYGFLNMWRGGLGGEYISGFDDGEIQKLDLVQILLNAIQEQNSLIQINHTEFDRQRILLMEYLTSEFSEHHLPGVFSSKEEFFSDASINVDIMNGSIPKERNLDSEFRGDGFLARRSKTEVFLSINKEKHGEFPDSILSPMYHYSRFLYPEMDIVPFVISAERFGISLFYKELDFTKNQLVDLLQRLGDDKNKDRFSPYVIIDQTTSRYALPIKENIDYTRSIADISKRKSSLYASKFFDDIKDMMGGYYKSDGDDRVFISKARGDRRFEIPLHIASSSARGLSDLYFYLRHVAKHGHLLIIDEPESHLDTQNQIVLARLLARMVNAGLKILVTTHSDYLVKEFNNLIMLSADFGEKYSSMKKYGYSENDFLLPTSVQAYVAQGEGVSRCDIDEFGINMPVFDETIDSINLASNDFATRLYTAMEKED